jgi:hypothetical protein
MQKLTLKVASVHKNAHQKCLHSVRRMSCHKTTKEKNNLYLSYEDSTHNTEGLSQSQPTGKPAGRD